MAEAGSDIAPIVVGKTIVEPTVVAPTAGNRVKLPPLAMMTGMACTEPVGDSSGGAEDQDCVVPTLGELQGVLAGALELE